MRIKKSDDELANGLYEKTILGFLTKIQSQKKLLPFVCQLFQPGFSHFKIVAILYQACS